MVNPRVKRQLLKISKAVFITAIGLVLLKLLPMRMWGNDILFDASLHMAAACMCLYFIWFFVDQNKNMRVPFLALSTLVLFVVSVQRIISNAHNDFGLFLGLLIAFIAISITERNNLKSKFKF